MRRAGQFLLIGAVAAAAGLAGYLTRQGGEPPAASAASGQSAEALFTLTLPDLSDTPQPLAQWRGKVLVLNFWATWCPPCLKEIPDFAAVSQRLADAPVQFVGIGIDGVDKMRSFQARQQVPYPLLVGDSALLASAAALAQVAQGLPLTLILDRDGKLHRVKLGTLNQSELEGTIRPLLAP